MMKPRRSFVSLYSGAGGLDLGFTWAGFEPIWANDFDQAAIDTYNANFEGKHGRCGDILAQRKSLPPADEVDLVIGGPPCQGFSVAGHMRSADPRSQHVWNFFDVVAELSPRAFVMENVAALAVNSRWSALIEGLKARGRQLGFRTEAFVLDASHFEVPQARHRMFLIGVRDADPVEPERVTEEQPLTVRDALAALPAFGAKGNDSKCPARITPARKPVLRRSPFAGMPFNGKGRALNLDAPAPTLPASMGGNRTPIVDQWQLDGRAEQSWIVGYHARLMAGRKPNRKVPSRMRRLTIEEAAALQTFPPTWSFSGPQSAQFRQIGNAVPPKLGYHVGLAVEQALRKVEQGEEEAPPATQLAIAA